MTKWSIEISKFDISFKPRKAQVFVDFIGDLTHATFEPYTKWFVFIDGSSNCIGRRVDLILESKKGHMVKASLCYFSTTQN